MKKRRCVRCDKTLHGLKGKDTCRSCNWILGNVTEQYARRIILKIEEEHCSDAIHWQKEIMLLSVKQKWNLLNPIDYYRVADIFIKVSCDANKYSTETPEKQCELMLHELRLVLSGKAEAAKKRGKKGKSIVAYKSGTSEVFMSFNSCKECAEFFNCSSSTLSSHINARYLSKKIPYDLRWGKDTFNI